jgi:hypothetical protein
MANIQTRKERKRIGEAIQTPISPLSLTSRAMNASRVWYHTSHALLTHALYLFPLSLPVFIAEASSFEIFSDQLLASRSLSSSHSLS